MARLSGYERPDVMSEHEQIATAVLARDGDLAVRLLVAHYRRTGVLLRLTKSGAVELHPATASSSVNVTASS